MSRDTKTRWKYALAPVCVMVFLVLYPQISFWISRGSSWNGTYVVSNYDEVAYSSYINALINGGPRRTDPFAGSSDAGYETLYSIQFIPAYLIAIPSRILGISASTSFIFLSALVAALSAAALFWLFLSATDQPLIAAVGPIFVLCFGTAAAFQGELSRVTGFSTLIDFFPFARRYQPGIAFPLFFLFCLLVWKSISEIRSPRYFYWATGGGAIFAILVFSYFYLWTAATAWFVCLVLFSFFNKERVQKRVLIVVGTVLAFALTAIVPYSILLSRRSSGLDENQVLTLTHAPDFRSPALIIGLLILAAIAVAAYWKKIALGRPAVILASSFALVPLLLFNQQILTGRSLQPIHYEIFIANYLVLAALVLLVGELIGSNGPISALRKSLLVYAAVAASIWGFVEASTSANFNAVASEIRDESIPAVREIQRSENSDPNPGLPVVLATNFITSDLISSVSTFHPLWNAHSSSTGGINSAANRRLFFLYLYYSGYTDEDLESGWSLGSFEVLAALFGPDRALTVLGRASGVTRSEISAAVKEYSGFVKNFDSSKASTPILNYMIVPAKAEPNYSNLDRWYKRDEGQSTGLFKVYKLSPIYTSDQR